MLYLNKLEFAHSEMIYLGIIKFTAEYYIHDEKSKLYVNGILTS